MKNVLLIFALALTGCSVVESLKPKPVAGQLRGPRGSWGHIVRIESNESGAKIEVNNEYVGESPRDVTIWGDKDGTFRGGMDYIIVIYPPTNSPAQFVQHKVFSGGGKLGPEDRIPKQIYFDCRVAPGTHPADRQRNLNLNITRPQKE